MPSRYRNMARRVLETTRSRAEHALAENGVTCNKAAKATVSPPMMIEAANRKANPRRGAFARLRHSNGEPPLAVSIRVAVPALVLAAILLTAAASSLLWWRTAEQISRQLVSTINQQIVAAVRKE